jgi:tRNA pseudouridine55 synthase
VLPIFFGRATVLADHLSAQGKAYSAGIVLGWSSTTDDAEGELTAVPIDREVDAAAVELALSGFVGRREQAPPAYSAVKIGGERSYRRARRGVETVPAPRPVTLHSARLEHLTSVDGELVAGVEIECGPGFYVRALARDLGRALGTGGHLRRLRRTRVGPLRVEDAVGLEEAEALGAGLAARLQSGVVAVGSLIEVQVRPEDEPRLVHGMEVAAPVAGAGPAYARGEGDRLLAIGRLFGGRFQPHRLVELG